MAGDITAFLLGYNMDNFFSVRYHGKDFLFDDVGSLEELVDIKEYHLAPTSSLSTIVAGNACRDREGHTIIMRFGHVRNYEAFPRLSSQIELMIAEPDDVIIHRLDENGSIQKSYMLNCATPIMMVNADEVDKGHYKIDSMLWTVKKVSVC